MDKIPFLCARKTGALLHAVSLFESFHTTGSIYELLLAGEEWVTGRTNFSRYFRFGGTGLESVSAQTFDGHFRILGMNTLFHIFPP